MEVYLLFGWIGESPLSALAYVAATMAAGVLCVKTAKIGLAELLSRLRAGERVERGLLVLGKMWMIGALLFFPGYLTDLLAAAVFVFMRPPPSSGGDGGGGDYIEVDSRVIDDER